MAKRLTRAQRFRRRNPPTTITVRQFTARCRQLGLSKRGARQLVEIIMETPKRQAVGALSPGPSSKPRRHD